jgi:hypothetical protein
MVSEKEDCHKKKEWCWGEKRMKGERNISMHHSLIKNPTESHFFIVRYSSSPEGQNATVS